MAHASPGVPRCDSPSRRSSSASPSSNTRSTPCARRARGAATAPSRGRRCSAWSIAAPTSSGSKRVLETLLDGITQRRAQFAILDVTGVTVVDTAVGNALVQAAQAVSLLGAQAVLTGIRPDVARTLVGLGVAFERLVVRGTLQSGIAFAMARG
ncbi:STAS domain-containing protein [Sorangium sp. So ce1036]|uniref:STAS domain-containing protein n=1 Tax=Sorangium sp. So ce1036 TaxID=3133328 RepID=UPI003F092C0A